MLISKLGVIILPKPLPPNFAYGQCAGGEKVVIKGRPLALVHAGVWLDEWRRPDVRMRVRT